MMANKTVVDTSGFFAPVKKLKDTINEQQSLATLDIIVFEFLKVIEQEIDIARWKGNSRREKVLQSLRERFPTLIHELGIEIESASFSLADVDETYSLTANGHESGDSIIWLKMKKLGWNRILTEDVRHWKSLGAEVVPISSPEIN